MDIGFKNHLPEFLRTPEVRNAGSTDYGMPDVGKAGSAECRENAGSAERRKNVAKRVKMAKKIQISEERPNSEGRTECSVSR